MIASVLNRQFSQKLFYLNRLKSKHFSVKLGASFQAEKTDEVTKSEKLSENEKYMKHRFEHFFAKNEKLKQTDLLYPHKFENTLTVKEFVKKFDHLKPSESLKDEIVKISGRIFSIRISGKKLRFLDLQQNESRVQIKAESKEYNQEFEKFETDFEVVRRGDVVGVTGFPCRTKMGELSIVPINDGFKILAPSLRILPSGTLEKPDHKYRRRYLDLMLNPIVRQNFKARSEIVKSIREFLDSRDFVEVETPILCPNVGGASATPFKTRHLDLDIDMFLRISPELYLKMLVVGGMDRVYEIGKQFRNEGLDPTHNPEFTSCEFYMAYADYLDLIPVTEQLLSGIQQTIETKFQGKNFDSSSTKIFKNALIQKSGSNESSPASVTTSRIDFTKPPYNKIDFLDSLQSAVGKTFPTPIELHQEFVGEVGTTDIRYFLIDLCRTNEINISASKSLSKLLDKLFGHFVEPSLVNPTFVLDHPLCMSPLAKEHRSKQGLSERFELYANGYELVNAYTELNDPARQREMFSMQRKVGDDVDKCFDDLENVENQTFVRALEYGLPPTAGWGLGVDRLVMLLTGQKSIRQVILFPTVRPLLKHHQEEAEQDDK